MKKPVIMVTGRLGQLGSEIEKLSSAYERFTFLFTDVAELNICDGQALRVYFEENKPDYCINAAAYTAVDKAETDKDLAMTINATAVGYLASHCKQNNTRFIHISTDYVFDGDATVPYKENDQTSPVNYYGVTKLTGEELAQQNDPGCIIIRTSWVYSSFGNNFVKTMLRLMKGRDFLNVVGDQFGSPTYAADLAQAILHIIDVNNAAPAGIYHFSNEGIISWFDFAKAISEISGSTCIINSIPTSGYPTPAKRPAYSGFNKNKIASTFQIDIPEWRDSLQKCMHLISEPVA